MRSINIGKVVLQRLLAPLAMQSKMSAYLTEEDRTRLGDYQNYWNFYNGFHWEDCVDDDRPEVTTNWCARFVNKYVATEFNSGFLFKFDTSVQETTVPFLNGVWEDNNGSDLMAKVGQSKSVTGDAYVHVFFESAETLKEQGADPFGMYPKGRIRLFAIPSSLVFPKYKEGYNDGFDALESVTIMYPINSTGILGNAQEQVMRYVYTRESTTIYINDNVDAIIPNKYGVIPIVPFRNLPLVGSMFGQSDLKDLINLNVEYNLKNSDTSQIIDYSAAPTTIVSGAKPHNLTKGANQVWCVPESAKVYNLELKGDLAASNSYLERITDGIYNIGSMPKLAIGGDTSPSNLSGLALQITFMPLLDLIEQKRVQSEKSIAQINKIILKIGVQEGLLKAPSIKNTFNFYNHRIWWGDVLPKDRVVELNMIQEELKAGITSREDAMTRLYKDDVPALLKDIEQDAKSNPQFYGMNPVSLPTSSRLVSSFDGKVIAKEKEDPNPPVSKANPQVDLKDTVGRTDRGDDKKIVTGLDNFNPPK